MVVQTEAHVFIANFIHDANDEQLAAALGALSDVDFRRLAAAGLVAQSGVGPDTPPMSTTLPPPSSTPPALTSSLPASSLELQRGEMLQPGEIRGRPAPRPANPGRGRRGLPIG